MASHDFCLGCASCDAERREYGIATRIAELEKVVAEISAMEAKKTTPKAKASLKASAIMFRLEIQTLKCGYE